MHKHRFGFGLLLALVASGCVSAPKNEIAIDQSTPKAALLSFFTAIGSGDAAAARRCVYVLPAHTRIADDMVELYAAEAVFHHVVNKHFPGQDKGIFWDSFTDATLGEVRLHLATAEAMVEGNHALFAGVTREPNVTGRLIHQDWRLRNDAGRWKVDLETQPPGVSPPKWDPYPPDPNQDITLAMMFLLHENCPGLRQIAADVEAGKLKSIEEVKSAAHLAASEGYDRANKKLDAIYKERAATRGK